MTAEEVQEFIRAQTAGKLTTANNHRIALNNALVALRMIAVVERQIKDGRVKDETLNVWLVGKESQPEGYMIVMREDGTQFGLATEGFAGDRFPILSGWYGDLLTTFLGI